jgi:hypothetical protein
MATKAQQIKDAELQASRKPKAKRTRSRRDTPADRLLRNASPTNGKAPSERGRNVSKRAAKKGGAAAEESTTARPSRKSTRRSTGRLEPASPLRTREMRRVSSPKARAARVAVKKRK